MKSPQKENGFTGIANEILEVIYSSPLSGSELRVLLLVFRKTYGWHKKEDEISLTQIVTGTKLSRKQVCEVINKLVTKRLLFKTRKRSNEYKFNKDYDEWLVTERLLGSYQTVTKVVTKTKLEVVTEMEHTKEKKRNYTKETSTIVDGGRPQNDLQILIDYSKTLNFPVQGSQKMNRYNASNLLKKIGLEKSKRVVAAAVDCRGKPFAPTINDFVQLYRKLGDLITFYQKEKNERDNKKPVIG